MHTKYLISYCLNYFLPYTLNVRLWKKDTSFNTHIFLVIFILFPLLIGHDDSDSQSVENGVISIGVVWSKIEQ